MVAYLVLFGIFAANAVAAASRPFARSGSLFLTALFLTIVIGLRREVGGDWDSYLYLLDRVRYYDLVRALGETDPAYALINWLAAQAGAGIWAVNLVCAAIFTWGLLSFSRQQPNPMLAILVAVPYLIIVVGMGYTRQSAAIGLVMATLALHGRASILRMATYMVLAVAFHKSALVVIPIIAWSYSTNRILSTLLLVALAIFAYYAFVASALDVLFESYVESEYSSSGAAIRVIMNVIPGLIFLGFTSRFAVDRQERRLWFLFSIASFVALAGLIYSPSSTAVDRVALYLIPLQIFVWSRLPAVMGGFRMQSMMAISGIIAYSLAVQVVWFTYGDNTQWWVPYDNFLWPSDVPTRRV